MAQRKADIVVIGAGPAGEVVAGRLAEHGRAVVLAECELVGGECAFYACMPSKGLLRPAEVLREASRVGGAAEVAGIHPDPKATFARRDEIIHELDDSVQLPWLESRGVELVRGRAELVGERRVRIGAEEVDAAEAVVIATGSEPALPGIAGLGEVAPWTNREATTASAVPDRLIVIGGGPVGAELAQAWRRLGAEVALVEAGERLLPGEEPFAGKLLAEAFAQDGIDVRTGAQIERVRRAGDSVALELGDGGELSADELLVAAGRRPRTRDIGLESIGLDPGEPLAVDANLRVDGFDWLYAVGDVNGQSPLTHMGKYQARLAADFILGHADGLLVEGRSSPRVVFTDPQIAAVGRTVGDRRDEGHEAQAIDVDIAKVAGSSFYGHGAVAQARFVIDPEREVVIGATFVAPEAAELLHAATIAIVGQVPFESLRHAVPAFPTRSELWLQVVDALPRR
jgi:dihydrolipoamide dehydrogenase